MSAEGGAFRIWAADDKVYPPIDLAQLMEWIRDGRVEPDTWVFLEAKRVWRKAGYMREGEPYLLPRNRIPQEVLEEFLGANAEAKQGGNGGETLMPEGKGYRVWAVDDVVYGPVASAQIRKWIRDGRVEPDTWVYLEEDDDWRQACEVDVLKPLF